MDSEARSDSREGRGERVEQRLDQPVRLALHQHVHEGFERLRIGEGQRPTGDDQRPAVAPLRRQQRNSGQVEEGQEPGELELVGHREGQGLEPAERAPRLQGEGRRAAVPECLDVIGEEGPFGCGLGMAVDFAVDGLEAQRAHPHVVRAGVAEGQAQGSDLVQGPLLLGEESETLGVEVPGRRHGRRGNKPEGAPSTRGLKTPKPRPPRRGNRGSREGAPREGALPSALLRSEATEAREICVEEAEAVVRVAGSPSPGIEGAAWLRKLMPRRPAARTDRSPLVTETPGIDGVRQ